jgi:sugar-phosphatase
VIFDMDGLLVDSEPLWLEAEVQALGEVGIPRAELIAADTTGLRNDETVNFWYRRHPWPGPDPAQVSARILDLVTILIQDRAGPMPGVGHALAVCRQLGLPIAIASSSPLTLIQAVMTKLGIEPDVSVIRSAESEAHGKPDPAIFLSTARELGESPRDCLVLEDSANGVAAAKAAGMRCIAVPAPESRRDPRFGIADAVLDSLQDVTPHLIQMPQTT